MANATRNIDWIKKAQGLSSAPWREEVLPLEDLQVVRLDESDEAYQRLLNESFVTQRVEDFDASEARTIYVSERADGTCWVMDGQHTREILVRVGISEWICRIFSGLTVAEEAKRFTEYQKNTRRVDPVTNWNAEVVAGEPRTITIENVLARHQLRIGTSILRRKDGLQNLKCLNSFEKIYELGEEDRPDGSPGVGGEAVLDQTLMVLGAAFGTGLNTYQSRVINGMGFLLAKAYPRPAMGSGPVIDLDRLINVLKVKTTPGGIVDLMGKNVGGGSAPSRGAEVILGIYLEGAGDYPRIKTNSGPKMPQRRLRKSPPPV